MNDDRCDAILYSYGLNYGGQLHIAIDDETATLQGQSRSKTTGFTYSFKPGHQDLPSDGSSFAPDSLPRDDYKYLVKSMLSLIPTKSQ